MIPINVPYLMLHSSFRAIRRKLRFISWISYNICFCKAALILSGLIFSHQFVNTSVVAVLITYLTDYPRNYNVVEAARLVNLREGISSSTKIFLTCIPDAFSRRPNVIFYSTISCILGLVLLFITAFEEAASPLLKRLILIGVVLLAVGKAGMQHFLGPFLADQLRAHEPKKLNISEDRVRARKTVWWFIPSFFSAIASVQLRSWRVKSTLTASATGITLFIFLLGIRFFHSTEITGPAAGSSLAVVFHVVKAALSKRHLNNPSSSNQLYRYSSNQLDRNDQNQVHLFPQVKFFRWLDKAAIIEPSTTLISPEEQEKAGRLCTVGQVRDTKLMLKMVPIWTTFVVFGLIVSTGQTFFPEQGNQLNPKGSIIYLIVIQNSSRAFGDFLCNLSLSKWDPEAKKKGAKIVRIWAGMVLSTICCAVAWRVEVHRLIIINNKGLLDNTDEVIPMSIFWLAPQFCLLGLMQGLARDGLDKFLADQFPKPMSDYVSAITELVAGFASFANIVTVYFNKNLFAHTLNSSRLDKYYQMLTIVSYINMCYFWWISTFYTRGDDTAEVEADVISQATGREEDEDFEVIVV